jgi:hypothetical protein
VSILQEIGLVPGVFDQANFDSLLHQQAAFSSFLPRLMEACFLRIPRADEWKIQALRMCSSSKVLSEILKTLFKENRVFPDRVDYKHVEDWLETYQLSHKRLRLSGVIVEDLEERILDDLPTSQISQVGLAKWWIEHPIDVVLRGKDKHAMVGAFGELLRRASRLDFIDPYLNPSASGYSGFCDLIRELNHNPNKPKIVFHTSFKSELRTLESAQRAFEEISHVLIPSGKAADVYIWDPGDIPDGFHARFLLTNLVGIRFDRGFQSHSWIDSDAFIIPRGTAQRVSENFRNDVNSRFQPEHVISIGTAHANLNKRRKVSCKGGD